MAGSLPWDFGLELGTDPRAARNSLCARPADGMDRAWLRSPWVPKLCRDGGRRGELATHLPCQVKATTVTSGCPSPSVFVKHSVSPPGQAGHRLCPCLS